MPTIIAIETSSELASVALLRDDQMLTREASGLQTHSQTVLPMLQNLLAEAGISLAQCDAIAFGAGPGSFTGVRTACGVVQGLAFGADLPVVAVSTLEAMAQACRDRSGATDVLAILDARMGEVYWAQYRYLDGWQVVIQPSLSLPSAVLPLGQVVACGNGLIAYANDFEPCTFAKNAVPNIMPHAEQVARLAQVAFKLGNTVAAQDAQPFYLRNKVALTTNERALKATKVTA
ncbi:MAG TPA: tRNA (adenosine(37)-N6)-threonylcarbamoyltransferase complex dimerization subunit type 1 TsaB [Burkholderiaceae bacterium]|jgi:tRNA threonylcarbamoyladenosine biosynthesis protein TsaB